MMMVKKELEISEKVESCRYLGKECQAREERWEMLGVFEVEQGNLYG